MTIALTGATGFVGRQILRQLLEGGHSVRVVVRERAKLGEVAAAKNLEIVTCGDIFNQPTELTSSLLQGCETLVHSAWYAVPGEYLHSTENIKCLKGTLDLCQAFAESGGRRFVGIGSCAEYGSSSQALDVTTPLAPSTLYSACKAAVYQTLSHFAINTGLSFAWCRLFYLHGEGEDQRRLVPYIERRLKAGQEVLLTEGNQVRDFLDVKVAARIICQVTLSDQVGVINVCSGLGISVRQFATILADKIERRDLLRFGARAENAFDPPYVVGKANFFISSIGKDNES